MRLDADECFDSGWGVEDSKRVRGSVKGVVEVGVAVGLRVASPRARRGPMPHPTLAWGRGGNGEERGRWVREGENAAKWVKTEENGG